MQQKIYDLLITGGGPTGLVLANLAGQLGLSVALIEKLADVYPIPRATHIDEETMRNFQLTGLMAELQQHIAPFGQVSITGQTGRLLLQEPAIQNGIEHGYTGSFFFDQPAFERVLRNGLKRYVQVATYYGVETTAITQTTDEVVLKTADGQQITARWAVGCDGGRSLVRNALQVTMDAIGPAHDWMIVDTLLKDPADAALLPNHFRYMLNAERVALFAYGIGLNNRWEFQLGANEPTPHEQTVRYWVAQYIPLDKIQITRIARYTHNSLIAQRWRYGRILLAGDAAHMMPPFAGQGMCSGVRDAVNLAWKLAAVINGQASTQLLDSYEQERRPHLQQIFKRTLFLSGMLRADGAVSKMIRNAKLLLVQNLPGLKNYLRRKYNIPTTLQGGQLYTCRLAGHHLPQVQQSDELSGYHSALVAVPGTLTPAQLNAAQQKQMVVIDNTPVLANWLIQYNVDFAIVRPDKIIFGAGKAPQFYTLLAAA